MWCSIAIVIVAILRITAMPLLLSMSNTKSNGNEAIKQQLAADGYLSTPNRLGVLLTRNFSLTPHA